MSLFETIAGFVSGIFKPAADLVDNVSTTDEERLQLRNALKEIEGKMLDKMVDLEKARLNAVMEIEKAESASTHWLRANWRPIVCLTLVGMLLLEGFGLIKANQELYKLAEIFLGTVAASRGIEKVASGIIKKDK